MKPRGFTLIEILLYVAIMSVILLSISAFLGLFLEAGVKHETVREVEEQGMIITDMITQSIRSADGVFGPATSTSAASISLNMPGTSADPTIYALASSTLQFKEGAGATTTLSSSRVAVSNLLFSNVSNANTRGVIHFEFTISYVNVSGRNEYNYSKTFYGGATLRQR